MGEHKDSREEVIKERISGSARIFYLLISISLLYLYASLEKIDENKNMEALKYFDTIYAILNISENQINFENNLSQFNLPEYFRKAQIEQRKYQNSADTPRESLSSKFPETPIVGTSLIDVPMRLYPGSECKLAITKGREGYIYNVITYSVTGGFFKVKSDNTYLLSFGNCSIRQQSEFNAILFNIDNEHIIGLPKSFGDKVPDLRPPEPFDYADFFYLSDFKRSLPNIIKEYANLSEEYFVIHSDALTYYLLEYASSKTGNFYIKSELDNAVIDLYKISERSADFLGIETTVSFIVRFGPLIILIFGWELWRRVRNIPDSIDFETTWFPFDINSYTTFIVSCLYSIIPVLISIICLLLFIEAQGLYIIPTCID